LSLPRCGGLPHFGWERSQTDIFTVLFGFFIMSDCEMDEWELLVESVEIFFDSIDVLATKYIFESKGKPDCSKQNS